MEPLAMLTTLREVLSVLRGAFDEWPAGRHILLSVCIIVPLIGSLVKMHPKIRRPPPTIVFIGLPVSGTLQDALRRGFVNCFASDAVHMRCRHHNLYIGSLGPYEAAIDLMGGNGEGGFDQLVIWHDRDNAAVFKIGNALLRAGWNRCYTSIGNWGDQAIYTRPGSPVRLSMDLSYWAKRRLRIIPTSSDQERDRRCIS
jgi:hypothetical protein